MTGRLHADLFPDGTVRMVFIPIVGGGSETPLTAKIRDSNNIVAETGKGFATRKECDRGREQAAQKFHQARADQVSNALDVAHALMTGVAFTLLLAKVAAVVTASILLATVLFGLWFWSLALCKSL